MSSITAQLTELATLLDRLPPNNREFARNLITRSRRRRLSPKEAPWVGRLIEKAKNPPPPPPTVQLQGSPREIFAMFRRAAEHLQHPKVHLVAREGADSWQHVVLHVAGPMSKYQGQVMVTDGEAFGVNKFFGRITEDGTLVEGRAMTPAVRALLEEFAANPVGIARQYASLTGRCCFCHLKLETPESTTAGYGPVCAENFGLPWGEVKAIA